MRRRGLHLTALAVLAVVIAGCGVVPGLNATPTRDPLTGVYIARGGGGALDAVVPLTRAFATKHPSITWQGLEDIGSDAAIKLVQSGDIDLGFISRELKPAEVGTVRTLAIGASGTALVVASGNPVKALSKDQLAKIYRGDITNWLEVGGNDVLIHVMLREAGAATRSAFESYVYGGKPPTTYAKNAIEMNSYDEIVRAIKSFPSSIGMVSMSAQAFGEPAIKLLTIDGIAPTRQTLSAGQYPMRRPLYLVYSADPAMLKPAVKAFLDFVAGPEGQAILDTV
jgi:phosphate transport system substrate-binding protein